MLYERKASVSLPSMRRKESFRKKWVSKLVNSLVFAFLDSIVPRSPLTLLHRRAQIHSILRSVLEGPRGRGYCRNEDQCYGILLISKRTTLGPIRERSPVDLWQEEGVSQEEGQDQDQGDQIKEEGTEDRRNQYNSCGRSYSPTMDIIS